MNKTVYEDGKYCMQDVGTLYLGTKYTMGEILEEEEINFKLRMLFERYVLPHSDLEDTLETHLYYLDKSEFLVKIYCQLRAKVKVNLYENRKDGKQVFTTKVFTVEELANVSPQEKEKRGMILQELSVSKFALMAF